MGFEIGNGILQFLIFDINGKIFLHGTVKTWQERFHDLYLICGEQHIKCRYIVLLFFVHRNNLSIINFQGNAGEGISRAGFAPQSDIFPCKSVCIRRRFSGSDDWSALSKTYAAGAEDMRKKGAAPAAPFHLS